VAPSGLAFLANSALLGDDARYAAVKNISMHVT